jgi:hypothetical protein
MVIGLARLDGKKGIVEKPAHVVEVLHRLGPLRLIGDELGAETFPPEAAGSCFASTPMPTSSARDVSRP